VGGAHGREQVGVGAQLSLGFQQQTHKVKFAIGEPNAVASEEQIVVALVQGYQGACGSFHAIHLASPNTRSHEDQQKNSLISLWCLFINAS
jgi:hypothetical protein